MRVLPEKREKIEKASERLKTQRRQRARKTVRAVFVSIIFLGLAAILVVLAVIFSKQSEAVLSETVSVVPTPTIEVVDEDEFVTGGKISSRMSEFIGLIERDFKDLGFTPVKAVIPSGSIHEIDFYFEDFVGYIKTTIDRDAAVTAEDMERMVRYLREQGKTNFEYIDVRVEGKGYWK